MVENFLLSAVIIGGGIIIWRLFERRIFKIFDYITDWIDERIHGKTIEICDGVTMVEGELVISDDLFERKMKNGKINYFKNSKRITAEQYYKQVFSPL